MSRRLLIAVIAATAVVVLAVVARFVLHRAIRQLEGIVAEQNGDGSAVAASAEVEH